MTRHLVDGGTEALNAIVSKWVFLHTADRCHGNQIGVDARVLFVLAPSTSQEIICTFLTNFVKVCPHQDDGAACCTDLRGGQEKSSISAAASASYTDLLTSSPLPTGPTH